MSLSGRRQENTVWRHFYRDNIHNTWRLLKWLKDDLP